MWDSTGGFLSVGHIRGAHTHLEHWTRIGYIVSTTLQYTDANTMYIFWGKIVRPLSLKWRPELLNLSIQHSTGTFSGAPSLDVSRRRSTVGHVSVLGVMMLTFLDLRRLLVHLNLLLKLEVYHYLERLWHQRRNALGPSSGLIRYGVEVRYL